MKKLIAIFIISLVFGLLFMYDGVQFFNNVGKGLPLSTVWKAFLADGGFAAIEKDNCFAGLLLGAVTSALSGAVMLLGGIAARMRCVKTCLVFSAASLALAVVAKILGFSGALLLIISSIINAILAYLSMGKKEGVQS